MVADSMRAWRAPRPLAGVTRIVCTPHCRDPYFDYDKMWDAFELLRDNADGSLPLQTGFEVNHRKLVELGIDAAEHSYFDGTSSNELMVDLEAHLERKPSALSRSSSKASTSCRNQPGITASEECNDSGYTGPLGSLEHRQASRDRRRCRSEALGKIWQ